MQWSPHIIKMFLQTICHIYTHVELVVVKLATRLYYILLYIATTTTTTTTNYLGAKLGLMPN
jgi:hypothetical protein